jgi:hypothetical protein
MYGVIPFESFLFWQNMHVTKQCATPGDAAHPCQYSSAKQALRTVFGLEPPIRAPDLLPRAVPMHRPVMQEQVALVGAQLCGADKQPLAHCATWLHFCVVC